MRAKHIETGKRVKIIAGVDAGKFGTIEGLQVSTVQGKPQSTIIAVRADGHEFARHYVSNQLHLVKKPV